MTEQLYRVCWRHYDLDYPWNAAECNTGSTFSIGFVTEVISRMKVTDLEAYIAYFDYWLEPV